MNRYMKLTERAATGDRKAAAALILEGYWPQNWDSEDPKNQDAVIAGSARQMEGI